MAKHCIRCGKEISDNALFCRFCGQDQVMPVEHEKKPVRDRRAEEEEYLRKRKQIDDTTKSRVIDYTDEDEYEIIDDDKVVISKKTLYIVGAIVVIAVIALGAWFFLHRDDPGPQPVDPPVVDTDPDDDDTVVNPGGTGDDSTGNTGGNTGDTGTTDTTPIAETTPAPSTNPDDYPEDFMIPGSNNHYITASDYNWMNEDEVQRAINEIYARRGRIFKDPEYSAFLNKCDWYTPMYSADEFNEAWFNEYEKENLKVLSAHRKKLRDKKKKN